MAKDHRLDLGRYVRNPFDRRGQVPKRLDFKDLFNSRVESGEYPWNPSRFTEKDLIKKAQARKVTLNPDLNFTSNTPFFDPNLPDQPGYEMFEGLGRFRRESYNFDTGRPKTRHPAQQPDFNPNWVEMYELSPTVNPGKRIRNPMPSARNPDPQGYIMARAESRAKNEIEDNRSVAELLGSESREPKKKVKQEEEKGREIVTEEAKDIDDKIVKKK